MSAAVDEYMSGLEHSRKDEIEELRRVILEASPELVEHIKWNAPSYQIDGDDRITMRLKPGDRVELVLHRGAPKRTDAFEFVDPVGLVEWKTNDRGVVVFAAGAVSAMAADVRTLVVAWVGASR